ncbi:MAG: hypothetical protein QOF44_4013 [Streptomyces sp.]|nr:hypothetical protein [Streptomyces sp.]
MWEATRQPVAPYPQARSFRTGSSRLPCPVCWAVTGAAPGTAHEVSGAIVEVRR